ncbi:beta-defensin 103 [Molossus molossus]|uniref:beta-defensin 103 n=1 Tax=Molossus molossus TaxID=27622 RepID=UPI00174632F3|nr:beta-defensin 103 [Molossus molossus]
MRLFQLVLGLLLLCLVPAPGNGGIISTVQKYFCTVRSGRCALVSCLPREDHIGSCSPGGRKCCRRRKGKIPKPGGNVAKKTHA